SKTLSRQKAEAKPLRLFFFLLTPARNLATKIITIAHDSFLLFSTRLYKMDHQIFFRRNWDSREKLHYCCAHNPITISYFRAFSSRRANPRRLGTTTIGITDPLPLPITVFTTLF